MVALSTLLRLFSLKSSKTAALRLFPFLTFASVSATASARKVRMAGCRSVLSLFTAVAAADDMEGSSQTNTEQGADFRVPLYSL